MASFDKAYRRLRGTLRNGEPLVWVTAAALTATLLITLVLMGVVLVNGLGAFWPSRVALAELRDGTRVLGVLTGRERNPETGTERLQFKTGNREWYGMDFRWVDREAIASITYPRDVWQLERQEYGDFYGYIVGMGPSSGDGALPAVEARVEARALYAALPRVAALREKADAIGAEMAEVNAQMERLRLRSLRLAYGNAQGNAERLAALAAEQDALKAEFSRLMEAQQAAAAALEAERLYLADAAGATKEMALSDVVGSIQPNAASLMERIWHYMGRIVELFVAAPRESNTEGGLFPAIFGTVVLVFAMSVLSFPLGVIGGIYLREYARQGVLVRIVRIAVNNLAGVPSIVYGIFGLGFFVYGIGGSIDRLFFPERLPAPTFGTGGILWASLTLGLLTAPVVVVATEEALGAIPRGIRESSLSLGATKFQTLTRLLVPMASPGIMTGFILAMARAAGEVAPLMITGVVKLAPALPVDGTFPYIHLERKFMHLGFHIYDIGFQSPNVEAAKPMVYVTTLLLVLVVLLMSSVAIRLRNRMKRRYSLKAF